MIREKVYPTLNDDSCVSHYNFDSAARRGYDFSERIFFKDGTLREGEQAAMSGFRPEDKIEIARMLDEAGVHYIQVGYPGLSESEDHMIAKIAGLRLRAKVGGLCLIYLPEWRMQIDKAVDCGLAWIGVAYGLSPVRLGHMMKVPLEEAVSRCLNAMEYAAQKKLEVNFTATDTTRTPLETLINLYRKAVSAGASMVGIADTAGAIGPTGMRYLVQQMRQAVTVPLAVHCHNDLGLAVANTIAAVEAGASIVDVTVNGLGERAGNASLVEVAAVLTYLYGYDTGIDLKKMKNLSQRVAELSGIPISKTKPLVGESAFTHTLGAHQWGVRQAWFVYEPVRAEAVGNQRHLPLGRLTHQLLVQDKLAELGFTGLKDDQTLRITERIRTLAEATGKFVTEDELRDIASRELG